MKLNIKERHRARELVLQALYQHTLAKTPINELEAQFLTDNAHRKIEFEYFKELLNDILSHETILDELIHPYLDRDLQALDPICINVLRISAHELKNRLDIPHQIIINEGVLLAKSYGATDSYKFVNGVLDKMAEALR